MVEVDELERSESDCRAMLAPCHAGFLAERLPALDDAEGARVPEALPEVVDAHVHVFPDGLFQALWRWFEAYGWPVRYRLHAREVIDFLLARGVSRLVLLHYAHKPGIARSMNQLVAELVAENPRVTGLATVFPGEPGQGRIVEDALDMGLWGVKLHCHVQCFSVDSPALEDVYRTLEARDAPLVIHAGREPKSPAYHCDPHAICSLARTEALLRSYPRLRVCVPHLGADEYDGYLALLERYDNLWLDTTMVVAGYFSAPDPWHLLERRPDRVLYGTDFPNLPYAWDRELRRIVLRGYSESVLAQLLGANARAFYSLPE